MQEYKPHPLADTFPMMSDDELTDQADDIRENGLLHPITLFEGMILDGRNRYISCKRAGIAPRYETFTGTFTEALRRVWSENVQRRHLTSSQCAAIIITQDELVARIEAEARERQGERTDLKDDTLVNDLTKVEDGTDPEIIERASEPDPKPLRNEQKTDSILAKTAGTKFLDGYLLMLPQIRAWCHCLRHHIL